MTIVLAVLAIQSSKQGLFESDGKVSHSIPVVAPRRIIKCFRAEPFKQRSNAFYIVKSCLCSRTAFLIQFGQSNIFKSGTINLFSILRTFPLWFSAFYGIIIRSLSESTFKKKKTSPLSWLSVAGMFMNFGVSSHRDISARSSIAKINCESP